MEGLKQHHKIWVQRISKIIFLCYIIVMVYFLFFSEHYGRSLDREYRYNLVLFKEIKRFIRYRRELGLESFLVNIFGNIFAFTPFGFVLPIISPNNRKFLNIFLLSLEMTLTIELFQLLLKVGTFDVDDIFLNTLGAVLGYIAFFFCNKIRLKSWNGEHDRKIQKVKIGVDIKNGNQEREKGTEREEKSEEEKF